MKATAVGLDEVESFVLASVFVAGAKGAGQGFQTLS